jgi:HAD superfamily hydrolase (TIGR01490 family)
VIAAFDFDGTITTRDTLIPFFYRCFGRAKVYGVFATVAWDALKFGLGYSSRDQLKAKVIARLFRGVAQATVQQAGREHAAAVETCFRPAALERIAWHRAQGHRLIMVSASLDVYLQYVATALGFDDLLCTTLEVDEQQVYTGATVGGNCRAMAKVRRLQQHLGDLSQFELYAYGDSAGDQEMLAIADHPSFKPFLHNTTTSTY